MSAMFVATPPFRVPDCYVREWLFVKWISVDAAEFMSRSSAKLYRIGIFDPGGGAWALVFPKWVDNQQVAELYGVRMMLKAAMRRKLPQVLMLQDNVAAIWAAVNLRARAPLRKQNRGRLLCSFVALALFSTQLMYLQLTSQQTLFPICPTFLKDVLNWLRTRPSTAGIYWSIICIISSIQVPVFCWCEMYCCFFYRSLYLY